MKVVETKIFWLLLLYHLLVFRPVNAQESVSLSLLPAVSQSSSLNPASRNKTDKLVIGLPFLSSTNFSWNTNFPLDALFSGGLWNYSFHDFYDNLDEFGEGQSSATFYMFYASLNHDDFTFSVALSERAFGTTWFNSEIVRIIRDGVKPYFGENEDFGSGSFNFNHYRELSFGVSWRYWQQLDIGIRPKILFGRTYFDAQDINFSIETDTENQTLLVKPEGSFTVSAPVKYNYNSRFGYTIFSANVFPRDYSFGFRNISFAVDIGAVFRPDKYSEIGISLLDFGYTGFNYNTHNADFVKPIRYGEGTLYQSHNPEGDDYLEAREALRAFSDSVSFIIKASEIKERIYNLVPFKLNLSGKYKLSTVLTAGINNQFAYYGKQSVNTFAGFLNAAFNPKTEIGGSLSLYNFSDLLIGLGASYTGEHVQYYISTDNIFGIIQTAKAKHLNLSFGINFLFDTVGK